MAELTKSQKRELDTAVDAVMAYRDQGCDPDEAIVKAAQDLNLGTDRLPVLVAAYNCGATSDRWRRGRSLREKVSAFPLADLDRIRTILYPAQTKSAAAVPYARADDAFSYSASTLFPKKKPAPLPPEIPAAYKSAAYVERKISDLDDRIVHQIDRQHDRIKQAMFICEEDVSRCLRDVSQKMLLPDVPDGEDLMRMIGDTFGPPGKMLVIRVKKNFPRAQKKHWDEACLASDHPFMESIQRALDALERFTETQAECTRALEKCIEILQPLVKGPEPESDVPKLLDGTEKQSFQWRSHVEGLQQAPVTEVDELARPQLRGFPRPPYDLVDAVSSAKQDQKIQQLRTNTHLVDVMNTDDYLSQQDPAVVLDAYNDLMEFAPEIRGKKALLAKALREFIATEGLDLSTLSQLGEESRDAREFRDTVLTTTPKGP